MHNWRAKKKLNLALDESGAAAIVFALVFAVLCGFVGLAFDIGHIVLVKAELQRTADAAAFAGVAGLVPYTGTGINKTPNWFIGANKAHTMIHNEANKADNQIFTITEGTVLSGYWFLNLPVGHEQTFQTNRPTSTFMPAPAIKVTLSRNVTLFFAPFVGVDSQKLVTATATAILPEANSIAQNVFAMAVEDAIVHDPTTGNIILAPQDFGWHDNAQWYTIPASNHSNDVPNIRISGAIQADNKIYIAPGSMNTLYPLIEINRTIILPVVASTEQKTEQDIIGFAPFYVTGRTENSIQGHFVDNYISPDAVPSRLPSDDYKYMGVSGTPKLVGP
jgi:hypothetical protein